MNDAVPALAALLFEDCNWPKIRKHVYKFHRNMCGHAPLSDVKLLLVRNNFCNDQFEHYLTNTIEKFSSCLRDALPKSSQKVSLSSMNRTFNEVVCVG